MKDGLLEELLKAPIEAGTRGGRALKKEEREECGGGREVVWG